MKVLLTMQDLEPAVRLNAILERDGIETALVSPMDDVRAAIRRERPDVLVLTGELLDPATLALVREQLWEARACIAVAESDDEALHDRMRAHGYTDVYAKPLQVEEAAAAIRRLLERRRMQQATGLIGESHAMQEVLVMIEQMAPVTSTVLIEGESGTGKELVARAIRTYSPRRNTPFIAVNVGALPETLLESELFGHEKGAFTGAAERRLGRFELAHEGTIFLDEIGEIPTATQVKLLRVLEEREVTRLGGVKPIAVDVRVIAATNRPLREHVEEGTFRSDLFYRLNVLRIYLPPLRERREDIPLLVRTFIQALTAQHDRPFHGVSADAMGYLVRYPWPGNVRELRNLVESMVVLSPGREIRPDDLPAHLRAGEGLVARNRNLPVPVGHLTRQAAGAEGRELEFIVRSLLELKLQVEELRRRQDDDRARRADGWLGEVPYDAPARVPVLDPAGSIGSFNGGGMPIAAVPAPISGGVHQERGGGTRDRESDAVPLRNAVVIPAGTLMADAERM
ncbi:MAG: sigma-54-dependent Fis family transcriptional regulator, partial [Gemmatimonadaceae bacterium]|nr:sigma-54-dependent Fis family transcriptional regulator [Gemmatimonadaceae bacterium]